MPTPSSRTHVLFSIVLLLCSLALAIGAGEVILRVKNSSMKTYDIEMWRYAKDLKVRSDDPALDFDHVKSRSSVLQGVTIRLNEWGLRGGPVEPLPPGGRRILFLGGSIALGWGVPEDDTVEARLERHLRKSGQAVQVLNGGVGNYNAKRYVSRFFKELAGLRPTDIVVHYFLRDAEDLPPGGNNVVLRNSELAVTLWIAYHRLFDKAGEGSLVDHYRSVYQPNAPGFIEMQASLAKLAEYARANNIRLYLAMTPDVHNLVDYKFGFVHDTMREIAQRAGYTYIDLLPAMMGRPAEGMFAMPGDPHPNALGHQLMADAIFPVLSQ
ncbi:MAG TPA: SGNH/GDSL hydrolase family protein [Vicinamibacterales bacterium]|jgi:lysophospholipase L1-like esterase|nr:SGNH/GDSL hydrolase family protein [Vicinamibacterales bacterium]